MSYDTNWANSSSDRDVQRLKKEADKLARFACAAMEELIKHGKADFLILKNDELREWWEKHQEEDRKAREAEERKQRRIQIKKEALDKLTDEEKEILGLIKKKKTGTRVPEDVAEYMYEDVTEALEYDIADLVKKINSNRF